MLLADAATEENLDRLSWLLAHATGLSALPVEVAGSPAASRRRPLGELARRGLGLELGSDRLARTADALDLPYVASLVAIDVEPSAVAIDRSLGALEAAALAEGRVFGFAQAYPVSLERLERWIAMLDVRGFALAPASAYLIGHLASRPGQTSHVEPPSRSQG